MVFRRRYITGDLGLAGQIEGFGPDEVLPNREACCEACAAIAQVYWADRMNRWTGDAACADMIEPVLHNGLLAGWSVSGDRFFYDNPLAADAPAGRQPWFSCACCPSNVGRFIPSVGRYVYAADRDTLYVNQFVSSEAVVDVGGAAIRVVQEASFPWGGRVQLSLGGEALGDVRLASRRPAGVRARGSMERRCRCGAWRPRRR